MNTSLFLETARRLKAQVRGCTATLLSFQTHVLRGRAASLSDAQDIVAQGNRQPIETVPAKLNKDGVALTLEMKCV